MILIADNRQAVEICTDRLSSMELEQLEELKAIISKEIELRMEIIKRDLVPRPSSNWDDGGFLSHWLE